MDVSVVSVEEGNTIPPLKRQGLATRWCFTWNNYDRESMSLCLSKFEGLPYVIGYEIGESGTPHLQGYVECKKKIRPIEFFKLPKCIHWESAKGDRLTNAKYCSKEGNYKINEIKIPKELKLLSPTLFKKYQKYIYDLIQNEPDNRSIYWFWEADGNTGKSTFSKYLCAKHNALLLSGKGADMKYGVIKYQEKRGFYPEVIIFDIPRTNMEYVSWSCLEDIKNGCFFSGKYESDMVIMNSPHIICFSNSEPDYDKLSMDRWKVAQLKDDWLSTTPLHL